MPHEHDHEHGHEHMVPGLPEALAALEAGRRRRKLWRGVAVSILTLAGLTLAAELFLRATHDRQHALERGINRTNRRWVALTQARVFEEVDDDVRRYAMRPGARVEVDGMVFNVSSHRTRGPDFPAQKPAGEKRLLALGDSFCFGMWCGEEETLVGHLARLANEAERAAGSGTTWRAIDLGVPGYHSGQQLRAFEQDGLALEPDVVVLYYNTNDIDSEGFFLDEQLGALRNDHLPLPTALRRVLWRSHLYGWVVRRHYGALKRIPQAHLDPRVPWANVRADNQAATRAAVRRIAELCSAAGVPLFFVNQPLWTWSGDARNAAWPVLPLVQWAEDLRAELGLPGLSLLGFLRGYADGVDRFDAGAPPDFLPDAYVADEAVVAALAAAKELARAEGRTWDALGVDEQRAYLGRSAAEVPAEPDFHLTGAGYGHIARLCYPRLREAGMLP